MKVADALGYAPSLTRNHVTRNPDIPGNDAEERIRA